LNDDGLLLFESHDPGYESDKQLVSVLATIERYFTIQEQRKLAGGSIGNRRRTFAVCKKSRRPMQNKLERMRSVAYHSGNGNTLI
jgi:spermidine synthase